MAGLVSELPVLRIGNHRNNNQQSASKADFWERHKETLLNSRQRLILNKLLDGFDGKLKTSNGPK
jgi:hypothetical protein